MIDSSVQISSKSDTYSIITRRENVFLLKIQDVHDCGISRERIFVASWARGFRKGCGRPEVFR